MGASPDDAIASEIQESAAAQESTSLKIGGTSYIEVGEGAIAEREVVRVVKESAPDAVPVREIVTLVAPVDTRNFDDTAQSIASHIAAIQDFMERLDNDIKVLDAELTIISTHTLQLESIEQSLFALTHNWLFRAIAWLGRLFEGKK